MPKDVARVLKRLRWGLIIAALVALLVLRVPQLALALAIMGLLLGVLGRQTWFQQFLAQLIGSKAGVQPTPSPIPAPEETVLTEAEIAALLDQEAQPAIFLKRHWPIDPVSDANSYLGGLPKLPEGMAWPENPQTGFALHHLAQIDLSEMPRIDADPNLPQVGMLWFFADINEEMDWEEGPGSPESCVLYAPVSTKELPPRPAPENLPQVDHCADALESILWSFRPPRIKVYPRWPVTGRPTQSWPLDDVPEGLARRNNYINARYEHVEAVEKGLKGEAPEPVNVKGAIVSVERVTEENAEGQRVVKRNTHYTPEALGGRFPYVARFADDVLASLHHSVGGQLERDESHVRYREKSGKGVDPEVTARLPIFQKAVQEIAALRADIAGLPNDAALSAADLGRFDDLIRNYARDTLKGVRAEQVVATAWQMFFQRTLSDPDLRAKVPSQMMASVSAQFAPSRGGTSHYLMGAKGVGSNPTAGHGIRLAQFDSDYGVDFMFCDCGIIDFWIDADDLAKGRWDRAWAATAGG
ncbi:DUF1963 domain-containing protein [Yoonia sp. BS5-3]|uniref:DUF1963 domain-containing protein n=1 Tax=Yoonia phaeophyticola TaxID=3137369 RepID=A0ABZ2V1B2_9RHOB